MAGEQQHVPGRGDVEHVAEPVGVGEVCLGHLQLLGFAVHLLYVLVDEGDRVLVEGEVD